MHFRHCLSTACAFAAFVIPLALYALTLCRGIPVGDSAELALAAARLQIAHPPGYPLLVLVGNVWAGAIFFLRPIVALNLLSAACASGAALMLFFVLRSLASERTALIQITALSVAIAFAATRTLWSLATNFEVYALSASLVLLAFWSLLRWWHTADRRALYLSAFTLGLGLANHLSVLALVPAFLLVGWFQRRVAPLRDFMTAAAFLVLALSGYLYLLLRPGASLVLSWYNPQTWVGFQQQVFAESYRRFLAAPQIADVAPYFSRLGQQLAGELAVPVLVLGLIGLIIQFRRDARLAVVFALTVLANVALNFSYTIADIAPYFLPTIIVACIWIGELLLGLSRLRRLTWLAPLLASTIAVIAAAGNWKACDLSLRINSELYARDLFARVPTGGLLLCGSDNSMFPSLYLRYVENYRPDCAVAGHLPTLSHLQRLLDYRGTRNWTHFRDLLDYGLDSTALPIVMVRELMNYENDYPRLRSDLISLDLVYVKDSALAGVLAGKPRLFPWNSIPAIYDPKEAALYCVYLLALADQARTTDPSESDRLVVQASQLVRATREPSTVSALAAALVDADRLPAARRLLESAVNDPTLRRNERLQSLAGLGHVSLRLDDRTAARKVFDEILALDAANTEARFQITAMRAADAMAARDLPQALRLYEELHGLAPDHAAVNFQLGLLYAQRGDTVAAIAAFQRCLRAGYRIDEVGEILSKLQ